MSEAPFLAIDQVRKGFVAGNNQIRALANITLTVQAGEFVCLLGPSGSGKSTLLRIIGGLLPADGGTVSLQGEPLTEPHPDIGFVFQGANLMPWRTVLDNVLLPAEVQRGAVTPADRARAGELLTLVALHDFADAYPKQLSGGMKQRVVLARTLFQHPKLLLMDEPFGALDAQTRLQMQELLLQVWQAHRTTVLFVTHDVEEALLLSDRIYVMTARPGRIKAEITVDLPRPRNLLETESDPRFAALRRQVLTLIRAEAHI